MSDNAYRLISLAIQLTGIAILVFKMGRYIGESSMMFKTLTDDIREIRSVHIAHILEYESRHERLTSEIADIRVAASRRVAESRRGKVSE